VAPIERHAAMPYAELPAFMARLRQEAGIAAPALQLAILCASRAGEGSGARWGEVDLQAQVLIVPGSRMKAGKEHRVPLSDAAAAIVEEMAQVRTSELVFPGRNGPFHSEAMNYVVHRLGRRETVHGFRSTFSSWTAERTNYGFDVREMALAHAV